MMVEENNPQVTSLQICEAVDLAIYKYVIIYKHVIMYIYNYIYNYIYI